MRFAKTCLFAGPMLASLALASPMLAQRGDIASRAFEDKSAGYRLNPPKDWVAVPVPPELRSQGLALQMGDGGSLLRVVLVDSEEEWKAWVKRVSVELVRNYDHSADPEKVEALEIERPALDEQKEIGAFSVQHCRWLAQLRYPGGQEVPAWIDTWRFPREHDEIGLIFTVPEQSKFAGSWLSAFERSAKSLETFEPRAAPAGAGTTYEEKLEAARVEAERTKGWHVVPTPSKKFILTTSCDNRKFVDEVIDRLERSRTVFEDDYPPPPDFRHVSIVRLCASEEEFHRYGKTGGGVMGWFNPESTELVLFDAKDVDRNMSYAVMTHEAFHQYCHFLFGRSEAHRWFDEGHGDYYGGIKFAESGKPKITAHMPGGLDRLPGIREMIQLGTEVPLRKHLNSDHAEWQGQGGPSNNVSGYCQSWSIVYMLRQGMLGKVNSKVWRKEYAEILPSYIETLRKGFELAYAAEREKRAKEAGSEGETTSEVVQLDSSDLGEETVTRIWKEAMAASWGKIELEQFEEDWKLYVKKYLKD